MADSDGIPVWLELLRRRWRFLTAVALAAGILSLGVSLVMPRWYRARAAVLPPREIDPVGTLLGLQSRFQLESVIPFSAGVTLLDVYLGILESDRAARSIALEFELRDYYRQSTDLRTLSVLRSRTDIAPTRRGIIEIKVEDRDPEMAARLANAYVAQLDLIFRETRQRSGRRQRQFLEERVGRARAEMDSLDAILVDVQRGAGLTALGRDATEASLAAADLISRRMTLGVQLEMLNSLGIGSAPYRDNLQAELRAVDDQIAKLPGEGMDLARSLRDLYIQERLFEGLSNQLEAARLEEVRNTEVVEILDPAVVPDRHVRPRRGLTTLAGLVAGLTLAVVWGVYADPRV